MKRDSFLEADRVRAVIEGMDSCFYSRQGYWTYEVCMSKGVRQFRQQLQSATQSSTDMRIEHHLGIHSQDDDLWTEEWLGGLQKFPKAQKYAQRFVGGSDGREAVVHYFCGRTDGIQSIREGPLLRYDITVHLRKLCGEQKTGLEMTGLILGFVLLAAAAWVAAWQFMRLVNCLRRMQADNTHDEPVEELQQPYPYTPPPPPPEQTPDLERTGECIICLEQIERSAVGSCTHHFCAPCLLECCKRTLRCPRCQMPIKSVSLDVEFDMALQLARKAAESLEAPKPTAVFSSSRSESALHRYVVRLHLPRGARAGITLRTCRWRFGVAVSALTEEKMAYRCGLRVGDVIVSMNGIPCRSHEECIEMINSMSAPRVMAESEILCLVIPQAAHVKPHCGLSVAEQDNAERDEVCTIM